MKTLEWKWFFAGTVRTQSWKISKSLRWVNSKMAQVHNKKRNLYCQTTDDAIPLVHTPLLSVAVYVFVATTIFALICAHLKKVVALLLLLCPAQIQRDKPPHNAQVCLWYTGVVDLSQCKPTVCFYHGVVFLSAVFNSCYKCTDFQCINIGWKKENVASIVGFLFFFCG